MNKIERYFHLLAVIVIFLTAACAKEEEEEVTKLTMKGTLSFDIPSYVLYGEYVTVEANGILDPVSPTYKWTAPGVVNDTIVGNVVTFHFPADSIGTFRVTASAHCDGYYTTSNNVEVSTIDTTFNTSLKGLTRSGKSIVDERDNHRYGYVTIGSLDWFSQNLAYDRYGVPFKSSPITWDMFGYFYFWDDVTGGVSAHGLGCGPQGLCPEGWTVPTNEDWEDLAAAMNGGVPLVFSDKWEGIGEKASADVYFQDKRMWEYSPDNDHTNDFGWNAIPMGYTRNDNKDFESFQKYGFWWSSSEKNADQAYYRYIYSEYGQFPMNFTAKRDFGASVRCVRLASR